MRLKRTYILLLVLSVVAAASIFVMLAYHFREGTTTSKKSTNTTKNRVTTASKKSTNMTKNAVLKYNNQTINKIEFDYEDTLENSPYYNKATGIVIIKDVLIPGQDAFDLNKDDTTDNKLYATQSGIQFIMKNVPPKIIENARIYKQMQKKQNNVPSNVISST